MLAVQNPREKRLWPDAWRVADGESDAALRVHTLICLPGRTNPALQISHVNQRNSGIASMWPNTMRHSQGTVHVPWVQLPIPRARGPILAPLPIPERRRAEICGSPHGISVRQPLEGGLSAVQTQIQSETGTRKIPAAFGKKEQHETLREGGLQGRTDARDACRKPRAGKSQLPIRFTACCLQAIAPLVKYSCIPSHKAIPL